MQLVYLGKCEMQSQLVEDLYMKPLAVEKQLLLEKTPVENCRAIAQIHLQFSQSSSVIAHLEIISVETPLKASLPLVKNQ